MPETFEREAIRLGRNVPPGTLFRAAIYAAIQLAEEDAELQRSGLGYIVLRKEGRKGLGLWVSAHAGLRDGDLVIGTAGDGPPEVGYMSVIRVRDGAKVFEAIGG